MNKITIVPSGLLPKDVDNDYVTRPNLLRHRPIVKEPSAPNVRLVSIIVTTEAPHGYRNFAISARRDDSAMIDALPLTKGAQAMH